MKLPIRLDRRDRNDLNQSSVIIHANRRVTYQRLGRKNWLVWRKASTFDYEKSIYVSGLIFFFKYTTYKIRVARIV